VAPEVALFGPNRFDGGRFFRQQQLYVFVGVALFVVISALRLSTHLWTVLVYSLCIGNVAVPIVGRFERYYGRLAFPFNWLVYLPVLGLASVVSASAATFLIYWLILDPSLRTVEKISTDIRFGALITVLIGIGYYIYRNMRVSLETQNVTLQHALRAGEERLERQEKELETAREIQTRLIPRELPQFDDLEISAGWQPAQAVGGDYFDVIKLNDHRVAICIADVVGKGIAAALLMANVQSAVRAFATEDAQPSEICDRLNRVLCSNLAPGKFVTFLYCIVDTRARTLTHSNAGHCFPLLARASGPVEALQDGGLVLGIMPKSPYVDSVVPLEAGDNLLLFTDGITEATNSAGEEFGEAGLRSSLSALVNSDVGDVHLKLMQEVSRFCGGNFADDATVVLVSYKWAESE
jgi:serine phosphatase RsbU (regulator of sigma subunit)